MGSPQGVTWSSGPLKRIKCRIPFKPVFKLQASSPCLGSMNAEPVANVTSHKGMGTEARGAVVNSLQRHLFQYGASLSHHESLPHRRWSCRYSERLQDGIHACLGWHCSRCRNWSHASNPKSLIKIYFSKQHLRDPEVQLWRDPTKKHSIFWSSYMSLE